MIELSDQELNALRQAEDGIDVRFTMPRTSDELLEKGMLALRPLNGCEEAYAFVTPEGMRALVFYSDRVVI